MVVIDIVLPFMEDELNSILTYLHEYCGKPTPLGVGWISHQC